MKKLKVLSVFGTRPEAIKMAPLIRELEKSELIDQSVCVTAQHRSMLDQVLDIFSIQPRFDLDIMLDSQTLMDVTTRACSGIESVLSEAEPDVVLVHGDTTTTFSGALAAFYARIPVGHVEAGLRTYDRYSPFPEELNRRLVGQLASYHFAPTVRNRDNLLRENITKGVYVTGNTVIDALASTVSDKYVFHDAHLRSLDPGLRTVLVTAHRRENLGEPLREICRAVKRIVSACPDAQAVFPVHLNPAVRRVVNAELGDADRVVLIDPIDVTDMHNLMARSYMVMTDSGGIQEEAPALGKPVLVLRRETERPEAVEAGTVAMAGVEEEKIASLALRLLSGGEEYARMTRAVNPYGDGMASRRIVQALLYENGLSSEPPEQFVGR